MFAGDLLVIFGAKYLFLAVPAAAAVYWLKLPGRERAELSALWLIALPLAYALARAAGHFYFLPRPFVAAGFAPLIPHAPDNGFPSEHALFSAAIAAAVFLLSRKLGTALWVIAALVGISRVLAGVHHTADIAGALFMAADAAWAARRALPRPHPGPAARWLDRRLDRLLCARGYRSAIIWRDGPLRGTAPAAASGPAAERAAPRGRNGRYHA